MARLCPWKNFEFYLAFNTLCHPLVSTKKFQPNRSSRLAGYSNIYTNVSFHYIEILLRFSNAKKIENWAYFTLFKKIYVLLAKGPGAAPRKKNNLNKKNEKKILEFFLAFGRLYATYI